MIKLPGVEYWPHRPRGFGGQLDRYPPRGICLHDTGNPHSTARGEANYAATRNDSPKRWTSAHFYVDTDRIIGSVPLDARAWAAFDANDFAWHIEMCRVGNVVTDTIQRRTAGLVWQLCRLGQIPIAKLSPSDILAGRRGIFGHWDVTQAYRGDHTDPGVNFDWTRFTGYVFDSKPVAAQGDSAMHVNLNRAESVLFVPSSQVAGGNTMLCLASAFGNVRVRLAVHPAGADGSGKAWGAEIHELQDGGPCLRRLLTKADDKVTVQNVEGGGLLSVDAYPA